MPWFNLVNHDKSNNKAIIRINDQIGKDWWTDEGIAAKDFINTLEELGNVEEIVLHINSPGGNVYDGLEIHNNLKRHSARVTVIVDGIAASIASVIAMAADEIIMPANTQMMIHNPSTWAVGDANEMRSTADRLDEVKDSLITSYVDFTGKDKEEIWQLMDSETYMSAEEAVNMGFATRVEEKAEIVNTFNLATIKAKAKAEFERRVENDALGLTNPTKTKVSKPVNLAAQIITMCHEKNLSYMAAGFVEQNLSIEDVRSKLNLAEGIQNLCAASGLESVSQSLVNSMNDPVEMLRIAIAETKSEMDEEIDPSNPISNNPNQNKPQIDNRDIYAKRRSV